GTARDAEPQHCTPSGWRHPPVSAQRLPAKYRGYADQADRFDYSCRRAVIGSTFSASLTGRRIAAAATVSRKKAAPAKAIGSNGLMPKRLLARTCEAAPARPSLRSARPRRRDGMFRAGLT